MKEKRRFRDWEPGLFLRLLGSVIALAIIAVLGISVLKFCMSLFATGDYIVQIPGADSPVLQQSVKPESGKPAFGTIGKKDETDGDETDAVTQVSQATVTIVGDVMMHMPTVRSGAADAGYDYDYIFSFVDDYIMKADYAVANLETTLSGTENGRTYTGYPQFNSPDAIAESVKTAGFDMMLTGNNHCYDYGTHGLLRTLEIVSGQKLDTLGTTAAPETPKYLVKDINGIKVGMICYTYADIGDNRNTPTINGLPMDSDAAGLVNAFDYDKLDLFYSEMTTYIDKMKSEGAEAILLYIHWGDELKVKHNDTQKEMAQKLCDLGVDVIAGGHPHVIQPVELLTSTTDEKQKTICLYSTGNFLSNQRHDNISLTTGHSEDGMLFSFTLVKYSDGTVCIESADILPTWVLIRGTGDGRKYFILPLDTEVDNWMKTFDISDDQLQDAQDSYNRTNELVSTGLKQVQDYLAQAKAERENPQEATEEATQPAA